MKKNSNATLIRVFLLAALTGGLAVWFWPSAQLHFGGYVTPTVKTAATWLAVVSPILVMGLSNANVIPMNGVIFCIGYITSMLTFMVTLLVQYNPGALFIEAFMLFTTAWKLRESPEKKDFPGWKAFWDGMGVTTLFLLAGLAAAIWWPFDSNHQLQGWWWSWIALIGGVGNSTMLFLSQMGLIERRGYNRGYVITCGVVAVSYMGHYSFVGVTQHICFWLMAAVFLLRRQK